MILFQRPHLPNHGTLERVNIVPKRRLTVTAIRVLAVSRFKRMVTTTSLPKYIDIQPYLLTLAMSGFKRMVTTISLPKFIDMQLYLHDSRRNASLTVSKYWRRNERPERTVISTPWSTLNTLRVCLVSLTHSQPHRASN